MRQFVPLEVFKLVRKTGQTIENCRSFQAAEAVIKEPFRRAHQDFVGAQVTTGWANLEKTSCLWTFEMFGPKIKMLFIERSPKYEQLKNASENH